MRYTIQSADNSCHAAQIYEKKQGDMSAQEVHMQLFRFVAVIHNKAAMVSDHYIRSIQKRRNIGSNKGRFGGFSHHSSNSNIYQNEGPACL